MFICEKTNALAQQKMMLYYSELAEKKIKFCQKLIFMTFFLSNRK